MPDCSATAVSVPLLADGVRDLPRHVTAARAAFAKADQHGWVPLAGYPGSDVPWPVRCRTCGRETLRYTGDIRRGRKPCTHTDGNDKPQSARAGHPLLAESMEATTRNIASAEAALVKLRAYGWTPRAGYPGADRRWLVRCELCAWEGALLYSHMRRGRGHHGCTMRGGREVALAETGKRRDRRAPGERTAAVLSAAAMTQADTVVQHAVVLQAETTGKFAELETAGLVPSPASKRAQAAADRKRRAAEKAAWRKLKRQGWRRAG